MAWALYMTEWDKGDRQLSHSIESPAAAVPHWYSGLSWLVDTPFNVYTLLPCSEIPLQAYLRAGMKRGHIELDLDKLPLFGTAGSGKTCSLAALLGVDPPTI